MSSVVEVCADYGGVNVLHICLNFGVVYTHLVGGVPLWVECVFRRVVVVVCHDQVRCQIIQSP